MATNRKEINCKPCVMYVKLSGYYISYLKTRYGYPVMFPSMLPISQCMERYLVNNPTLNEITPFCYCEMAFQNKGNNPQFSIDVTLPPEEERSKYMAVTIPAEVYRSFKDVRTSETWQLSVLGTKRFRREVKREFWIAFSNFYDDCWYRANRIGEKTTAEDIVTDFMTMYNIDMNDYDNMMRQWRRIRDEINDEIEKRREALEIKTGNALIYTP